MLPIVRRCPVFLSSVVPLQALSSSSGRTEFISEEPKSFSSMPSPTPIPFLGNSLELKKNMEAMRYYYEDCFNKYGNIYKLKTLGSNYMVLIKDPSAIEHVMRAEGKYPIRDNVFSEKFAWLLRNRANMPLLLVNSGESWKAFRTAAGKQTMPRNVQRYHSAFTRILDRFKEYIKSARDDGDNIKDIDSLLKLLTIELSAKIVYGSDWDVVSNATAEDKEFIDAVAFFLASIFRVSAEFPWYRMYADKFSRDFKKATEIMQKKGIREAEKNYESVTAGVTREVPGLLEQWLIEGKMSIEDAINESVGLFTAAVDTTSNQACFLLHDIAKNQDVQDKLYQEIKAVLGEEEFPTTQHLSQMPYMKGCIQESFRLNSTAGGNLRVVIEDTVLLGYRIPSNTTICYSIYCAGRDSSLFSNPLKFDPERWQRDKIHPYAILPFGFGPRSCYGKRFAELELKLILVQMVKNFKLTTDLDVMDTVERTVVCAKGEVPIKFTDRK